MTEPTNVPTGVDPTVANVARIYDYLLGGSANYEIDRATAAQIEEHFPEIKLWAWCNRGFHQRAARWLVAEAGIRQFLDIGAGLPTQRNTHEVVQEVEPKARVVYVDLDPLVATYAQEIVSADPYTTFVQGDLRDPDGLLANAGLRELIDFDEPVALMLSAVLHFVPDDADPAGLIRRYLDAFPSGSYLAISHATLDGAEPVHQQRIQNIYQSANEHLSVRSRPEIERFFAGLELLPPYEGAPRALTYGGIWGAEDPVAADDDAGRGLWVGVARTP